VLEELRTLVEIDLQQLKDEMEIAGAPWTPGRKIPKWKKKVRPAINLGRPAIVL
jgi:hypothetical protein